MLVVKLLTGDLIFVENKEKMEILPLLRYLISTASILTKNNVKNKGKVCHGQNVMNVADTAKLPPFRTKEGGCVLSAIVSFGGTRKAQSKNKRWRRFSRKFTTNILLSGEKTYRLKLVRRKNCLTS